MTDSSSVKERVKRFIRHGGRDSAKSKKEDGSSKYGAVSSLANSSQANVHPSKQAAPSTTVPAIQQLTKDASASLSAAVPSTAPDTALHSSPNTGAKAEIETNITEDLTTDGSLWNKAYDILKNEKDESPNLIAAYEDILSRVLIRAQMKALPTPNETEDVGEVTNQIPQHDVIARREKLKEITELGLKHMEDKKVSTTLLGHEIILQDAMANVAGAVKWTEDYIKDAVKDLPYASIVMVGVSLVLPLLKNPTAVEAANQDGLTYVTSQIRYYIAMESLLLPKDLKLDLKADLTERLVELYKLIIDFQVRSILRFYRSRTKNFFRGTINYDGWDKKLREIKEGDAEIRLKFETALSGSSLQTLKELVQQADTSRRVLDGLLINVQELVEISRDYLGFARKMDERMSDTENRACLRDLQTTNPCDDKDRIELDKGGLLRDSYHWVLSNEDFKRWRDDGQSQLLWIKGDPGKGKTMLLCGIIDELIKSTTPATNISFFFCQATDAHLNNATAVLRNLLYLLVKQQQSLISHIRESYDDSGKQRFEGKNAWVALSKIFTGILGDQRLRSTYLIIDALDECITDLPRLLDFIALKSSACSRIKWIVSSRNWSSIEKEFNIATQKIRLCLELNERSVSAAVTTYIRFKVDWLAKRNDYDSDTREVVQRYLSLNAKDTFLWVALVCKELTGISGWKAERKLTAFPPGLDAVYERMMDQICNSDDAKLCKSILAVVSVVYQPITLEELVSFVDMPPKSSGNYKVLAEIIGLCGSFVVLRGQTILFVHQSAKDYLEEHASAEIFPEGRIKEQQRIVSQSIKAMDRVLKRDIYDLQHPGFSINEVEHPDSDPLAPIRYACVYWIDHLYKIKSSHNEVGLCDTGTIDVFLRKHFLHWLEALSLMGKTSEGVIAITLLESIIEAAGSSYLYNFLHDAKRFILYSRSIIEEAPLQIYHLALLFAPEKSIVRIQFKDQIPEWIYIRPKVQNWSLVLQTLEGHSSLVTSVAFSPDGSKMASASSDQTVRLWNVGTGQVEQTLEGHSDTVLSVAFSPDGSKLASASDRIIRLWNVDTGQVEQMLEDHSGWVSSVAFSPDGSKLASASDRTVRLWNVGTGQVEQTLEGHSNLVMSVAFSPDGNKLASASSDQTVRLWNVGTGQVEQTLEGHLNSVSSVAFSPDGSRLASASDQTVRLWNVGTGQVEQTLEDHSGWVSSVAFSPDGSKLASASDRTVRLWNVGTGQVEQTLEGHSNSVMSVAFSPDGNKLASASSDQTVRLWNVGTGQVKQTLEGHSNSVSSVAFSPDGSKLASASYDRTVPLWNVGTGKVEQTLEGHSSEVMSVAFSPDGSQLASASSDQTVRLWNVGTGQVEQTLEGHSNSVSSVAFSPDGSKLASASDQTVRLWNVGTGQVEQTLEGHSDWIRSVAFSPDGSKLASASSDQTVRLWNVGTGQVEQTLEGHSNSVSSVAFSPDGNKLALASDETVRLWNVGTGQVEQTLEDHSDWIRSVAFSPDGSKLASASYDRTVPLWNVGTGKVEQTLEGHSSEVMSVAFSPDGSQLASASSDQTVRLWNVGTGKVEQTLEGHSSEVMSVAFSPDGSQLASASYDRTVRLWNVGTGKVEQMLEGHSGGVSSLASLLNNIKSHPIYTVDNSNCWVTRDSSRILHLPWDYRPGSIATEGCTLAIGAPTGRVMIMTFRSDVQA